MTSLSDRNAGRADPPGWDAALDEAAEWSVLLLEEPGDAELQDRFRQWMDNDPIHAEAWDHINHVTGLVAQTSGLAFFPANPVDHPSAKQLPPVRTLRPWRGRSFAAVAAAAAIAWVAAPALMLRSTADHVTGTAEERTIALEDGSTIRLAPDSAVTVAYSSGSRQIELLTGEAYFEVSRDPSRPFNVIARTARVSVLGTGFDVRLGEAGTDVAVSHGRVRVEGSEGDPPQSRELTEGKWARVDLKGRLFSGEISPASVAAWSGKKLVAVDRPLSEVVADVRRYYSGRIILSGDRLTGASVTGSYDMADPAAALRSIVGPHGGHVHQISPWLLIVR
ncbi:MAG: FecR domain-containing protein [Sphingobium sp.]